MKIAIGCDHGGYDLKNILVEFLKEKNHNILDVGCYSPRSCDYPEYGYKVARLVQEKKVDRGILICKTGIGYSIVANKLNGVRAALCLSIQQAKSSREHNYSNVLVLGSVYTSKAMAKRIVSSWLVTRPLGGRHARRVRQIEAIERRTIAFYPVRENHRF